MSRNEVVIQATPDEVFAVLSDAEAYEHWVVGCLNIRGADPGFPAVGTRFHHTVGLGGPIKVSDHTEVIELDAPRSIVLKARARPGGTARVQLELSPFGKGTRVVITETAGDLLTRLTSMNPLVDPLVKLRNAESMRRLKVLGERRHFSA